MEIRRATAGDAAIVRRLNREVQQVHAAALPRFFKPPSDEAFPPATFAALVADAGTLLLIGEVAGTPVGYALATFAWRPEDPFRHALGVARVDQLSVDRPYQGRGYGERLLGAVIAQARERGIGRVELDVWAFNERARRFYARRGFAVYNERMALDL